MAGQQYLGHCRQEKIVSQDKPRNERVMKETYTSQIGQESALRHCQTFTESQRKEIFQQFWKSN